MTEREETSGDATRRELLRTVGFVAGVGVTGLGSAAAVGIGNESPPPGRPEAVSACGTGDATPPRPGPAFLYDENPTPPQLENSSGWTAEPLLVSGTEGYDDGEYLYQDYVYDDHGADTSPAPTPPEPEPETTSATFSGSTGDVVYPTDRSAHLDNAADLLEFRCRPVANDPDAPSRVAYRFTMNTMVDATAAAVAVGIDTGSGSGDTDWGHGLGELGAAVDHVLVASGDGATLDGSTTGVHAVDVDTERNQLEVVVDLEPGHETWTHYCVTGLWDADTDAFRQIATQPTAEQPGGANGQDVPPIFNVAFRFDEPFGSLDPDAVGSRSVVYGARWDHAQAKALADRDISQFGTDIDFGRLRAGTVDRRVPTSGYMSRLYASAVDLGSTDRFDHGEGIDATDNVFLGRIQPYTVYVPESYDGSPTPTLLLLHSLGGSSTQYGAASPNILRELGEANDTIVVTPEGRGPSSFYQEEGELDVFEAFRDVRNRYAVDFDRVSLAGYSMGGYGTYKFGAQYPDLFAKGFSVVGPAGEDPSTAPSDGQVSLGSMYSADPENTLRIADNLRHVPLLLWNGMNDELVPYPGVVNHQRHLANLGYRHELDSFPGYDHFLFAVRDQWGPVGRSSPVTISASPRSPEILRG
jgi:pimeloyl-ACP methyl ester carboxylesterase